MSNMKDREEEDAYLHFRDIRRRAITGYSEGLMN